MFSFLIAFAVSYVIGFIIGFIQEMTGIKLRYVLFAVAAYLFYFLVSRLGFGLGILAFLVIAGMLLRYVVNYIKGAIYGFISLFTHKL